MPEEVADFKDAFNVFESDHGADGAAVVGQHEPDNGCEDLTAWLLSI